MGGDLKRPQGKPHRPVPRTSGSSPAKAKPHMRETRPQLRGGPPNPATTLNTWISRQPAIQLRGVLCQLRE